MRHILSARQFGKQDLEKLFASADQMQELVKSRTIPQRNNPDGIAVLFFEASTRTDSSFQLAAQCLGIPIRYSTRDANVFSSAAKGESLKHMIRVFCNYPYLKAIVIRHPDDYSAEVAAEVADSFRISIINGGDGSHEHPTQAALDLFTIKKKTKKPLSQVKLVVANDIKFSRTICSLLILFANNFHPAEIGICAPNGINLSSDIENELIREGIQIKIFRNLLDAACWADFLYMTRPQIERAGVGIDDPEVKKIVIEEQKELFRYFRITRSLLELIPPALPCQIMHPMPINRRDFNEITEDADDHPRCIFFDQAANGLPIRMAILDELVPDSQPTA